MRVASVGFWHLHGTDYAREAQQHPGVDLVALWDADPVLGEAGAAKHGVPFVPRLDTILDDASIDAVIVCTPTSDHRDVVLRCIRAGKHVFLEKVVSSSLQDARMIVAAAREAGVALTVSLWRSDRGYAHQIADLVASGTVGRVTSARIRDGHPFALPMPDHPDGYLPDRFYEPAETEGGVLIDLCHPLYLLAMIIGPPESVSTAFGHVTDRRVEDNAAALLSYAGGAIGIAETSYVTRITPFTIEVHGTEGSILYSEPGIGQRVADPDGTAMRDDPLAVGPRLRYWSHDSARTGWVDEPLRADEAKAFDRWVGDVSTGTRSATNLELALQLSAIVEAAYTSAAEARTVRVESV